MKQHTFEATHSGVWQQLESLLAQLGKFRARRVPGISDIPALYRQVCQHYSIARSREYSPQLQERLHLLVLHAHQQLYGQPAPGWLRRAARFFVHSFPAAVRRDGRLFLLTMLLFYAPAVVIGWFCFVQNDLVYSVLDYNQVMRMEQMYDTSRAALGREREADTDFMMFGYYIQHNIGIGFRTFAGGLLVGLGTVLALLFNGAFIGAVAGHLTRVGHGEAFWQFVVTHGALELTAITITSLAGFKLAHALLAPGALPRSRALIERAREAVPLVIGAMWMLVGAAFIEAFWSSSMAVPAAMKYAVAGALWLTVAAYFLFMGRGRGD
jgi:uncharacterized membrane protein SpoIIM required for sporulation